MKNRTLLAFLLVAIALHAAPLQARTAMAENTAPFHWSCERKGAPTVAEIRDHFGIANAGQAYQWRGIAHRYLRHECLRTQRLALERDQQRLAETGARAP
ncbi:MAG: hypothetical protein M0P72_12525 [Metallibacterium scheffleri]|jgi:hypothetical protein|uniref:hypothetical protein n=1 Tax=Metallibacterium scheffleri TaxID=993689 RepID=UPI0026EF14F8|nr:hypothetical protein [Metallibacterium scheffleri]MCK9367956.1 hypothetical protein [Metallibacterium scheffleri]